MHLGIAQQSGLIYEGVNAPDLPSIPLPTVTQAKLIESEADWNKLPNHLIDMPMSWVFREDSFDAVTRVRRGRLYEPSGTSQPVQFQVSPHPYEDPMGVRVSPQGRLGRELFAYRACTSLFAKPRRGLGAMLALGTPQASSGWRIVQVEALASGSVMLTLKALTAFGVLPDIEWSKIDQEFRPAIERSISIVLDSAFRAPATAVVDACRDALTILLSRWIAQTGDRNFLDKDLGKVGERIGAPPHDQQCSSRLAFIVARLHARGKGNEQHSKGLRAPVDDDAEFAIQALGFVLREIGWARG